MNHSKVVIRTTTYKHDANRPTNSRILSPCLNGEVCIRHAAADVAMITKKMHQICELPSKKPRPHQQQCRCFDIVAGVDGASAKLIHHSAHP